MLNRRTIITGAAAGACAALPSVAAPHGLRFSTNPADPGYEPWQQAQLQGLEVLVGLEGREVTMVETVDEAQGFLVQFLAPTKF